MARVRERGSILVVVLVVMGLLALWAAGATAFAKRQFNNLAAEKVAHAKTTAAFKLFVDDAKRLGDEAKAKAKAEEEKQAEVNNALVKKIKALGGVNAELRADNLRLRERPPERPDRSPVPVTSACPAGSVYPPGTEFVPLGEYRELESRCAYDARTVTLWRGWARAQGLAGPE